MASGLLPSTSRMNKNAALMANRSKIGPATTAALVASVVATVVIGSPSKLPSVALGSSLVLHVERTIALFVAYLLVAVVLVRAWEGRLPDEISGRGLKYATQELKAETHDALDALAEHAAATTEQIERLQVELETERAERLRLQARLDDVATKE